MKKVVYLSYSLLVLVSCVAGMSAQAADYACTSNTETGQMTCQRPFTQLATILKNKKITLADWQLAQQELESLLDAHSQNYNPAVALKTASTLIELLASDEQQKSKSAPIVKQLLNIVLTILIKGLHRPGYEASKRTVEHYVEDLLALYLLASRFNFESFIEDKQLEEPALPEFRTAPAMHAYYDAKAAYDRAQKSVKLLALLTRDSFTLNDLYVLYGKQFSLDKKAGEDKPSLDGVRCNDQDSAEYKVIYYQQLALLFNGTIIEDLARLYDEFKERYLFGDFYKRLADEYKKFVEHREILDYARKGDDFKYLTPEASQRMMSLLGLGSTPRWPGDCSWDYGNAVRIYNKLIDAHDALVQKLKIEKPVKAEGSAEPLEYVTPSAIRSALDYTNKDFILTTLCIEMGACSVDGGQAVSRYKDQPDPDFIIKALLNNF